MRKVLIPITLSVLLLGPVASAWCSAHGKLGGGHAHGHKKQHVEKKPDYYEQARTARDQRALEREDNREAAHAAKAGGDESEEGSSAGAAESGTASDE